MGLCSLYFPPSGSCLQRWWAWCGCPWRWQLSICRALRGGTAPNPPWGQTLLPLVSPGVLLCPFPGSGNACRALGPLSCPGTSQLSRAGRTCTPISLWPSKCKSNHSPAAASGWVSRVGLGQSSCFLCFLGHVQYKTSSPTLSQEVLLENYRFQPQIPELMLR